MSAVINPASPVVQVAAASSSTTPELVLQPGTVIEARVLAVRENLARILIAGLSIEVLTEVALQPGANLKLAVSQTPEGNVRLAVVTRDATVAGQAGAVASGPAVASASPGTAGAGATTQAALSKGATASPAPASPEAVAVSHAVQASAPRQAGLAPLFANLPVVVAAEGVPRPVQAAAVQLLATRPRLDGALTADDLRLAFRQSGLFLEATLARGVAPSGAPDLKAALVVFKQVLANWLGQAGSAAQSPPATASSLVAAAAGALPAPQGVGQASAPAVAASASAATLLPLAPGVAPSLAPADPAVVRAEVIRDSGAASDDAPERASAPATPQAPARQLTEPSREIVRAATQALARDASPSLRAPAAGPPGEHAVEPSHPTGPMVSARLPSEPAPPFRGAMPSPQPVAAPSLAPDAPPASMGRELLEQTEASLARQTLLQVASLPDRSEPGGANQSTQPRWSFEIPFATPQGTAVAQFEIARDGGNEVEAASASRVWRARFTLDVEPAGPVHALVSLIGDKTAVRIWAERAETAATLRVNADALGQALRQAELEPGDILVGEGAPPQPTPRPGRFLDRAT